MNPEAASQARSAADGFFKYCNLFPDFFERHANAAATLLLFIAFAVRSAALLSITKSVYSHYLLWDERLYHSMALEILKGNTESSSLFSWVVAFLYFLFTADPMVTRIFNTLLGTAVCFLIYLTGKELAGRKLGLASLLIAALYKPLILFSIVPMKTMLTLFFFVGGLFLILKFKKNESFFYPLLLGCALGFLANIRPNCLIFVPFAPVLLLRGYFSLEPHSRKNIATIILTFLLGFSIYFTPVIMAGISGHNSFRSTSGQAGMNLYLGNNLDNPAPYYSPVPFAHSSPFVQERHFAIEASRNSGKRLNSSESSAYWMLQVYQSALSAPFAFIKKIALKTSVLFHRFEAGDHYDIEFMSSFVPFFKIPLFQFFLIFPAGIAGIAFSVIRRLKGAATCLSIFLLYGATLVIFFTNMRYRLPLAVILIPFSVLGICWLINDLFRRRSGRAALFAVIAAAAACMQWIPIQATEDTTAYYNTHAIVLNSLGKEDEALDYWELSSQMGTPYSAFANLALEGHCMKNARLEKARFYLDKIAEDSFASASKYDMLGDLLIAKGDLRGGIDSYEHSLSVNSGQIGPRVKLARLFQNIDPRRSMAEREKLEYILSFYHRTSTEKSLLH